MSVNQLVISLIEKDMGIDIVTIREPNKQNKENKGEYKNDLFRKVIGCVIRLPSVLKCYKNSIHTLGGRDAISFCCCDYLCEIVLTIQQICCIFELKKRGQKIMNRTFIEVPMFTKKWHELGLTDDDLRNLENVLLKNPKDGDAIQGTGGLRKIRIPMENKGKGKRGGARVIYVDIEIKEIIYFINVYTKNEKDELSEDEKKAFKAMIKILKEV